MIDIESERLIGLTEAAKYVPPVRGGKRVHLSTILRWIVSGAKGPGGDRIKLEAIRLGGSWKTSREALQRFGERLTPDLDRTTELAKPRSPAGREHAAERAARELEKIGI
jgi:hypothetical protein